MLLRTATVADLAQVVALERLPESVKFVGQWSEERHRDTLQSADARYFVNQDAAGQVQAYAILRGFGEDSHSIELKRVVVAVPGVGLGRRIVRELMRMAFEDFGAHRLFLDVFEHNVRARHIYETLGFTYEGVMRDAAPRDGGYCSLHLMSMLEGEYRGGAAE